MTPSSLCELRQFCLEGLEAHAEDILSVREAFAACDSNKLLAAVLRENAGWRMPTSVLGDKQRATLLRKIESTLAVMAATTPLPQPHSALTIVPWEHFALASASGAFRRSIGAVMVDVSEHRAAQAALRLCGGRMRSPAGMLRARRKYLAEPCVGLWEWGKFGSSLDGFAFESWSNCLAQRVWLPRSLCEYERYCVLASVFWSMTYLGFNEEDGHMQWGERLTARASRVVFAASASSTIGVVDPNEDEALAKKMRRFVDFLNYGSWVDFLAAVVALGEFGRAA